MLARAIEAMFYGAAVNGTHKAMKDMGMVPADAEGTPLEQIRAVTAPPPEAIADEPRGRKAREK